MYKLVLAFLAIVMFGAAPAVAENYAIPQGQLKADCTSGPSGTLQFGDDPVEHRSGTYQLTAVWEPKTVSLIWDGAGHGTAPTVPDSCVYGESFTTAPAMAKDGQYSFQSWYANGNHFNPVTSVNCDADTLGVSDDNNYTATLYAQWEQTECDEGYFYTINGCSKCPDAYPLSESGADNITDCYKEEYPDCVPGKTVTPKNCIVEWSERCDCSLEDMTQKHRVYSNETGLADGIIVGNTQVTCHRDFEIVGAEPGYRVNDKTQQCLPEIYRVNYSCGEGNGDAPASASVQYLSRYTMASHPENCTNDGYDFKDWLCRPSINNATSTNDIYMSAGYVINRWEYLHDLNCEATWKPVDYTITYDCNIRGVPTVTDTTKRHFEDSVDISSAFDTYCHQEKPGYEFDSWDCVNSGSNVLIVRGNVTCTAQWNGKTYNITYKPGEHGQGDNITKAVRYGAYNYADGSDLKTLLANAFTAETGYKFKDWTSDYLVATGAHDTTTYNANWFISPYKVQNDTEMIANWELETYNITYEVRSNSAMTSRMNLPSSNPRTYTVQSPSKQLVLPTSQEYTFSDNWYECDTGEIVTMIPGGYAKDLNLCVDVQEEEYDITYIGCINGNCENYIELNNYIDSDLHKYSRSHWVIYPTIASGQFDIDALNADEAPNGPYEFNGKWFKDSGLSVGTNGVLSTQFGDNITVYTDLRTYFHVDYDCGENATGIIPVDNKKYTYDNNTVVVKSNTCEKQDYDFVNWTCGSDDYDANETFVISSNTTCSANWELKNYQLTLDCNTAESVSSALDLVAETSVEFDDNSVTVSEENYTLSCENQGYEFVAWNCDAQVDLNNFTMPRYDVKCVADWNPLEFDIVYTPGVMNGTPIEKPVRYGESKYADNSDLLTLPFDAFQTDGYEIYKWLSSHNVITGVQENIEYDASAPIKPYKVSGDTEMVAQWRLKTYDVRYFINPGQEQDTTTGNPGTYNVEDDVLLNAPAKEGFERVSENWYICNNAALTNVASEDKVYVPRLSNGYAQDLELCFDMQEIVYPIRYIGCVNGDCDNNSIELNNYIDEDKQTYSVTTPTVFLQNESELHITEQYIFSGDWYVNSDFSGERKIATEVGETGQITVYTNLKPYFRVDYDCGEGTTGNAPIDDKKYTNDDNAVVVKSNTCEKQDYDFVNWTCGSDNYDANETFEILADTTCSANWKPKTYVVKYNCNLSATSGSQFVDDNEYVKNDEVSVLGAEQCGNNSGYEFDEWTCDNNIGQKSENDTFFMPAKDVECIANWKPAKYNVRYYCDEHAMTNAQNMVFSDLAEYTGTYIFQTSSIVDENCSHDGYKFDKWNCTVDNNVQDYKAKAKLSWKYTNNMDCYARWNLETYRINYTVISDSNETVTLPSENPREYTIETPTVSLVVPTKENYTLFDNWYECNTDNVVTEIPGGYAKDLDLCINMETTEYKMTYLGCVNGDCSNPILLNGYVLDSSLLTYSVNHPILYPRNNAGLRQLDIDALNADKYPNGPYEFDSLWFNNPNLSGSTTNGTLASAGYRDKTVYTNLRTYFHVDYDCDGGIGTPQDDTQYLNGKKVRTFGADACGEKTGYYFDKWMCADEFVNAGNTFTIKSDTTCTAQWLENTYLVTYDCNGGRKVGTYEPDSVKYDDDYTFAKDTEKCTNKGYIFVDWKCDEAKNSTNSYVHNENGNQDTVTWNIADDLICHAEWDKQEYNITYFRNVDDTDNETISGLSPDKYSVTDVITLPTTVSDSVNIGYTFKGWSLNRSGNTTISGWRAGQRTGDIEVYAQWKPKNYVIKYFGGVAGTRNVTSVAMSNQNVNYGDNNVVLNTNTYALAGYKFVGWKCVATDNQNTTQTITYDENEPHTINVYNYLSDMECTAQWEPKIYDITYEVGNCAGQRYIDSGALTYDATYSLRMPCETTVSVQSMPGYEFKGWRTRNSTQPDQHAGRTYGPWTQNKGLTLYGVCEKVPYNVSYNCDSTDSNSVTPTDSSEYYYGDNVVVKSNTCKKLGSTFDAWECYGVENSNVTWSANENSVFTMPGEDVVCKAKWNQNHYNVTYDCDGGNGAPTDSENYTYDQFVNTLENSCVKTGYDFTNWKCAGVNIIATEGFHIYDNTVCYAEWEPKKYDIIYNNGICNGGSYTEHSLEFGKVFEIRDRSYPGMNIEIQKGYEFLGWSTDAQATDVNYNPNTQYGPWMNEASLSLYAVCKIKEYTITYNHNGGAFENGVNALTVYTLDTPDEAVPTSVRNGYVFQGWFEDSGFQGSEVVSVPDMFKANPHDVTLYAKWSKSGKITFVCPTDFSATPGLTIDVDSIVGETVISKNDTDCEINQCTIEKWQCGNNDREYAVGAPVVVADDTLTCRAIVSCSDEPYQITYRVFSVNELTGETTEVYTVYTNNQETDVNELTPKTYMTGVSVTYPDISLSNHEFIGWYDNIRFNGSVVTGTPTKPSNQPGENITVYGKMLYNAIYTITYHNDMGAIYDNGTNPVVYTADTPVFDLNNPTKDGYRFKGWHLDSDNGQIITQVSGNYKHDLDLYAEWEFACNEQGQEHWLHVGEGENDKICLYETKPAGARPVIKIQRSNGEGYYYAILSNDTDTKIHQGSSKKMRIRRGRNTYNVCDKSTCP